MNPQDIDINAVAEDLLAAAVAATPTWIATCIGRVAQSQGLDLPHAPVEDASDRGRRFVEVKLTELLRTDIDRQRSTPLTVFREAVRFPVEVLHHLGAAPTKRGDVSRWAFPSDPFALTPASLSDIGPDVHEAGIAWGATKAALHLARRR